jgi:hypothetical protein
LHEDNPLDFDTSALSWISTNQVWVSLCFFYDRRVCIVCCLRHLYSG